MSAWSMRVRHEDGSHEDLHAGTPAMPSVDRLRDSCIGACSLILIIIWISCILVCKYIRIYIRTEIHTYIHTYINKCIYIYMYYTYIYICAGVQGSKPPPKG